MALKSHAGRTIVLPESSGMGESRDVVYRKGFETGQLIKKAQVSADTFTAVDYQRLAGHER